MEELWAHSVFMECRKEPKQKQKKLQKVILGDLKVHWRWAESISVQKPVDILLSELILLIQVLRQSAESK